MEGQLRARRPRLPLAPSLPSSFFSESHVGSAGSRRFVCEGGTVVPTPALPQDVLGIRREACTPRGLAGECRHFGNYGGLSLGHLSATGKGSHRPVLGAALYLLNAVCRQSNVPADQAPSPSSRWKLPPRPESPLSPQGPRCSGRSLPALLPAAAPRVLLTCRDSVTCAQDVGGRT